MSDILPLWGAYVEYPLPTEQGTCAMATDISEQMGGPHVKDSLSPWAQTKPLSLSCLCLYCNKSNNSRESLLNHQVLQLNLMWLKGTLCQVSQIGENQTHHLRTTLELWQQRLHTHCKYGLMHQMMRRLHIEAKSFNAFERNGQPRSRA